MGTVIMLVVVAVVLYVVFIGRAKWAAQVTAEWREVAERFGLTLRADGREITGVKDGVDVRIHTFVVGTGNDARRWTELSFMVPGGVPVHLTKEGVLHRVFAKEDVTLGDPAFDRALHVRGDRVALMAMLDASRRRTIIEAVRHDWVCEGVEGVGADGAQVFHPTWTLKGDRYLRGRLPAAAALGFELAAMLRLSPEDVAARLADRAATDPEPAVRSRAREALAEVQGDVDLLLGFARDADEALAVPALAALLARHRDHPGTRVLVDALREGLPDRSPAIRDVLAPHLGAGGLALVEHDGAAGGLALTGSGEGQ